MSRTSRIEQAHAPCQRCGAVFMVRRDHAATQRFCSLRCGSWHGGITISDGYRFQNVQRDGRGKRYLAEHRLIVERAIGRTLPASAVVHHVNEHRQDNANRNLVALQSERDHTELHRKMRVRAAGGDPWSDRLCYSCGPKPAKEFYVSKNGTGYQCKDCARRDARTRIQPWKERRQQRGLSV